MVELINLKLSTNRTGIRYDDISEEKALELTKANIGTVGPRKITIEWGVDEDKAAEVKPLEDTVEPSAVQEGGDTTSPVTEIDKTMNSAKGQTLILPDTHPEPTTETDKTSGNPDKLTETHQPDLINSVGPVVLSEIARIDKYEFTTSKFVPLESNLSFAETPDGRIVIKYAGTKINTTWKGILKLEGSLPDPIQQGVALLEGKDVGNRRTAVVKFIKKMREKDIKQGDGVVLFNKIFKDPIPNTDKPKNDGTDTADFRHTGVGSSVYPPSSPKGQDFGDGR